MKTLIKILVTVSLFLMSSCTSTKYVVQTVDTSMEVKGSIDGSQVGLNKKNEIIIQSVTDIVGELKGQEYKNYDVETKVQYVHESLSQCRKDIADPRLGGSGVVQPLPEIDGLKAMNEVKESIGQDRNENLVVVKREYYLDRLSLERQYGAALKTVLKASTKLKESCEHELSVARVKAGLPANKYESTWHYTEDGHYVVDKKGEHSLDDAFEIKRQLSQQQ